MKLVKYYRYIIEEKGLQGRIELSVQTKISSIMAPMQPDSPENIKLFKDAIKEITGKEAP